ncbi:MAG: DUF6049 family protein [Canibacter sp.]
MFFLLRVTGSAITSVALAAGTLTGASFAGGSTAVPVSSAPVSSVPVSSVPISSAPSSATQSSTAQTDSVSPGSAPAGSAQSSMQRTNDDVDAALPTLAVAATEATVTAATPNVEFTVQLSNPTEGSVAGGEVQFSVTNEPVTSRNDLTDLASESSGDAGASDDTAGGNAEAPEWLPIGEATIASAPATSNRTESVSIARSDLPAAESGEVSVYMVQAEYTAAPEQTSTNQPAQPETLTASAPIIVQDTITQPAVTQQRVNSTVVVPLVFPEEVWSLPTRSELSELFAENAKLPTLLKSAESAHATLAIDPRILVSIRGYGDEAPDNAQQFLSDLEASNLQSFLLQFGDADISAQAAAGRDKLMAPTGASFITRFAVDPSGDEDDTDTDTATNTDADTDTDTDANQSASGNNENNNENTDDKTDDNHDVNTNSREEQQARDDSTGLLSIEQLSAWNETAGATAWPADGEVNDSTISLIKTGDIEQVIVQDDNVTREGGPRAEVSGLEALITDHEVNRETAAALDSSTETLQNLALSRTLALTALAASKGQDQGLVFTLDRGSIATSDDPAAVLDRLSSASWLNLVDASQQPEGRATLDAQPVNTDRSDRLRAALERESTVRRVGDTLVHPEYLTDYHRMRLLSLFATRWSTELSDFADVAESFRERDTDLMNGVEVIGGTLTQVFGSSSRIPVQVRNSLPFEAVVHGLVVPANGALTVETTDLGEISIPAGESTTVLIPIQSRVTSGDSGIVVTLNSANGSRTLSTQTFEVSISSQVETVAVFILLAGAVLFVGFGVWRSVKRRRREVAAAPETGTLASTGEGDKESAGESAEEGTGESTD